MIVRTMVEICAKFLISRLEIGGAMAISLVAMATATLILFLFIFFFILISFCMFFRFSCQQFLFSSSCSVIVRVSVVLKRTVGDSD